MTTLSSINIYDRDVPVHESLIYEGDTIKQGVYNISNEEYQSSSGLSRSGLMEFTRTPFHYWSNYISPDASKNKEESDAFAIGEKIHKFILERDKFYDEYVIVKKVDGRTKEGKEYNKYIEEIAKIKKIINENEFDLVKNISASLMKNPMVTDLLSCAEYEKSLYWRDKETGILCKARPDIWHPNMIVDIKSSKDASLREFQRSIYQYGYHLQSAFINQGIKSIFDIDIRNFIFIVIEKEYPNAHAVYMLDEFSLDQSISELKKRLNDFKECQSNNDWPSYPTQRISLPAYANLN